MTISFTVNGSPVTVVDDGSSLLQVLREQLGLRAAKDGCSPQGQCGCCTVLVDDAPRVSCVTPARRVAGRSVTTVEGLSDDDRQHWGDAFCATGGSQCGFCTPGIVARLEGLRRRGADLSDRHGVAQALTAHLCRCTGWQTVVDAAAAFGSTPGGARDLDAAGRRAAIEGGTHQVVAPAVALGEGGFADDTAPAGALVAVPDGRGGWVVGDTLAEARHAAGKVQGRRTTDALRHPLTVPDGPWAVTLSTTWVEPAYLELDASWCVPGGEPASPLANGGAFGGKVASVVGPTARRLADEHGRAVRVVLSREDVVRTAPKRPPVAGGVRADGSGVLRVVATPGVAEQVARVAPDLVVEQVSVPGPPTSVALRAAGWAEAVALLAGARQDVGWVRAPGGGEATASVDDSGVHVTVRCGEVLDETVLRSYCIGAAHMALGWVTSEGIAVDDAGEVHDLTIRSFGVLRAVDTPPIEVTVVDDGGPARNGSDAVFAAVAAATWLHQGCPPEWPTGRAVGA